MAHLISIINPNEATLIHCKFLEHTFLIKEIRLDLFFLSKRFNIIIGFLSPNKKTMSFYWLLESIFYYSLNGFVVFIFKYKSFNPQRIIWNIFPAAVNLTEDHMRWKSLECCLKNHPASFPSVTCAAMKCGVDTLPSR